MKRVYIIAIIMALLAGGATYFFADSLEKKAGDASKQSVCVAVADIPAGTIITQDNVGSFMGMKSVLLEDVSPNVLTNWEEIAGEPLVQDIYAGEQINRNRFNQDAKTAGGLSVDLKEGEVAYSISAEAEQGVDGYIKPGDTVNIVTYFDGKSEVSFENLEVLKVATYLDVVDAKSEGNNEVKTYVSITVRTTKEQQIEIMQMEGNIGSSPEEGSGQNFFKFTLNSRSEEESIKEK